MAWKKRPRIELDEAVLIVDDEEDICEFIAYIAEAMGLRPIKTTDPALALPLFVEHKPFLVISDFRMPGISGLDICQQIKAQSPATPFVLYTAFADRSTVLAGLRVKVDDVLEKPCSDEQIYRALLKYAQERLTQLTAGEEKAVASPKEIREEAKVLPSSSERVPLPSPEPLASPAPVELREPEEGGHWVSHEALDQLVSMLGEFVALKNQVELLTRDQKLFSDTYRSQKKLKEISTRTGKIADRLQGNIMAIRKIRLDKALAGLPRIARQRSEAAEKPVNLSLQGLEFGVDKATGKILADALTQLLQNAIDQSIESPRERAAASKPQAASIEVAAYEEAGEVHLIMQDDGRGIDPLLLMEKAVANGLVSAERAAQLTPEETFELLSLPGLGGLEGAMGSLDLEALRANLLEVQGRMKINAAQGQGSRFELIIPVARSIAVEKTLLVRSDETLIAIPLASLATLVAREDLVLSHVQGRDVCLFQGQSIALYDYYSLIGRQPIAAQTDFAYALFIKHQDEILAFKAQAVVGHLDAVIRPFDDVVQALPAFKGTTVLGDERVAFILSAEECLNLVRRSLAA